MEMVPTEKIAKLRSSPKIQNPKWILGYTGIGDLARTLPYAYARSNVKPRPGRTPAEGIGK
eukprot:scaffold7626_cov134-Isochrysis_galbana.AAC.5